MAKLHMGVDLPADPERRKRARAEAIHAALSHAASSPDFRLDMILGEGCGRVMEVARWMVEQIAKDETLAPGLGQLAEQAATRLATTEWAKQLRPLLLSAVATLRIEAAHSTVTPLIEHRDSLDGGITIDHELPPEKS